MSAAQWTTTFVFSLKFGAPHQVLIGPLILGICTVVWHGLLPSGILTRKFNDTTGCQKNNLDPEGT